MKYSTDSKVDAEVRELLRRGAVFEHKEHGKHNALRFPNSAKLPIPRKPDRRGGLNWLSQLKRILAEGAFDVQQAAQKRQ